MKTQGAEFDADFLLPRGFAVGGAYTYLDARDEILHAPLTNRNRHQGFTRIAWEEPRIGLRMNVRGTFYSSWIVTRATTGGIRTDTTTPGFAMWDFYAAQRLFRRERSTLELFGAVDNFTDSRDPNTGLLSATGAPLPIYRAEAGRAFRLGMRYTFAGGKNK